MKDFNFIHDKTKHDKKLIQTILNQGNKKKKVYDTPSTISNSNFFRVQQNKITIHS